MARSATTSNSSLQSALTEEQIYKIIDTETGKVLMTGRTNDPVRRAGEYAKYDWWKPTYKLVVYRTIERRGLNDDEYGLYASCAEHMEICRNRTWDTQGARNQMSPIVQCLWGPEALSERSRIAGSATSATTNGRKSNGGRASGQGRLNAENKTGVCGRTPEQMSADGRKGGATQAKSGFTSSLGKSGLGGRATAAIPGHMARAGRIGGTLGGVISTHNRYHINRNLPNPRCALCSFESLVVAFA